MATAIVTGARVVLRTYCYTGTFQIAINTTYWERVDTLPASDQVNSFNSYMDDLLAPLYKVILANNASYLGCGSRLFAPVPNPNTELTTKLNTGVGTGGAGLAPTQCAPVISFKTGVAGPRGRSRIYLPFMSASALDADGTPTLVYNANALAVAVFLASQKTHTVGPNAFQYQPVVYGPPIPADRIPPPVPPRLVGTFTTITEGGFRDRVGTQRRRGTYGRTNVLPF